MVITGADLACLMASPQQMMGCCLLVCSSKAFVKRGTLLQGQSPRLPEQLTADSVLVDDSYLPLPGPHCPSHVEAMLQQADAEQADVVMMASLLHSRDSVKFVPASDGLQQK